MTPDREKELVEALARKIGLMECRRDIDKCRTVDPCNQCDCVETAKMAVPFVISAARPLIAREATEKVLRDLYSEVRDIRDLLRKAGKYEVKCLKWKNLMTRYENYATEHNIPLSQEGK